MALKDRGGAAPAGAWLLPGYLVSLALVFFAERIAVSDGARYLGDGLGLLGVVATTAVRFARSGTADGERGRAERVLAFCSAGGLLSLAIYFTTTETGRGLFGVASAKPETRARIEGASLVAWVSILLLSVLPLILGELALAPMRRAAMIEARRVRAAIRSGFVLACALLYCSFFTYAAGELDLKADYSYFRTARASESTKNIAATSTETIHVKAFFPQLNEVGTEVSGYLRDIEKAAPGIEIEEYDRLLVPAIAKEAKVTTDGVIVLNRGASRDTMTIGTDMKVAAAKLKTLDGDFQKSLLKVLREAHVAYLTIGHGELNENKTEGNPDGHTGKLLRKLFESQNYTVKDSGPRPGARHRRPRGRDGGGGLRPLAGLPAGGGRLADALRRARRAPAHGARSRSQGRPRAPRRACSASPGARPCWPTTRSTCGAATTTRTAPSWSPPLLLARLGLDPEPQRRRGCT